MLNAFAKIGTDVFEKLFGMRAFAIYEKNAQKLWLVRDRLGIKPLFYSINENGLRFASEIKGILSMPANTGHECNKQGVHE